MAAIAVAVLPVATRQLGGAPHVAGVFGAAICVADLVTFLLLASQVTSGTSASVVVIACAYLYSGSMALLHVASFPGAIVASGPLLGNPQTVGWLFLEWRLGFAAMLLAAVLLAAREARVGARPRRVPLAPAALSTLVLVAALLGLALWTPSFYFSGPASNAFGQGPLIGTWAAFLLCAIALAAILLTRSARKTLYLWLGLVLLANALGLAMSESGGMRYTVGWYAARAYALVASGIVLTLMLAEVMKLQRSLAGTVAQLARQTQSLQAEIHRRETAERRLVQAEQLEAMGRLAGGVAHDFNNYLQVIGMRIELLRRRAANVAGVDGDLAVLSRTLRRAEGLTTQLLTLSGRRAAQPRRVNLHEWLPPILDLLRSLVRSDVPIGLVLAPETAEIEVDPAELEAALINLVANSRDALDAGGRIELGVRNRPQSEGEADGAPMVEITVADNGRGIAPALMPRVFEPFFTTKETGKGSGLGLSQVYAFAQRSNGSVSIDSQAGRGTKVTLLLPHAKVLAALEGGPARAETALAEARGRSVLIVDDNEDVVASTGALLEQRGFVVHHASTGREALDLVSSGAARPRVVLSDIVMPGPISGLELARRLRRAYPDVAVILSTAYSEAAVEAVAEGFLMLAKPYQVQQLEQTMQAALRSVDAPA